jgi:hypothetical protein
VPRPTIWDVVLKLVAKGLSTSLWLFGGVVWALGLVLFLGNVTGRLTTLPFAGYATMSFGSVFLLMAHRLAIEMRARASHPSAPTARLTSSRPQALAPSTIEMSLTPEIRAFLEKRADMYGRAVLFISFAVPVLAVLAINRVIPEIIAPGVVVAAAGICVIVLAIYWGSRRDLRKGVFLRSAGPFTVWTNNQTSAAYLKIAGHTLMIPPHLAKEVAAVRRGEADYTKSGNDLLELRDALGRVVYRPPRFQNQSK